MRAIFCIAAAALLLSSPGCTKEFPVEPGLLSFEVTVAGPHQFGTDDAPLEYVAGDACTSNADCGGGNLCQNGACVHRIVIDVQAIGRDGEPWPFFSGDVNLRVTPGEILSGGTIRVEDGVATGQEVTFRKGYGKTHVWVEDDGYAPHDRQFGQCSDGIDNDNNGYIDMADVGCFAIDDDSEAPVGLATGVSPTIYFDNPTIRDVQNGDQLHVSPLRGQQVSITSGTLVVANILASGFYVVDLQDNTTDRLHNAMFIFTFSKPQGLFYGDVLCGVSGSVQDFVGATQLSFPSFTRYVPDDPNTPENEMPRECEDFPGLDPEAKVPEPWDLSTDLVSELEDGLGLSDYQARVYANSLFLEKHEGNLGTFSNLAVAERFVSCDINGNGSIDSGTIEFACRNDCQEDPLCTDIESYFEFNQYAVVVDGKKKVYGSTLLATAFSPLDIGFIGDEDASGRCTRGTDEDGFLEYACDPLELESITGSVRQIYLCGETSDNSRCDLQFWVLDPRFDSDVVLKE